MEYKFDTFVNSSNMRITNMVRQGSIVLDVGCASGYLANRLKVEKKCLVYGIEIDSEMAARASNSCEKVFLGDIENLCLPERYYNFFDYIIFGDVLEHTKSPEIVLNNYLKYLKKDTGNIIISLPNCAYWLMRLSLLFGKFNYKDCGIMDRTHLRFFTKKTAIEMIKKCNLEITGIKYPGRISHYVRIFPALFAYQFLFLCSLNSESVSGKR
ncbi:MAG: hypothetical protein A2W05_06165 [Candidatus Schekmanbacteria bacterium RBG_16_38_10]|uniref:Methyltransferase domain-containing protein n=1 Tax=Candidatus Schekmanbacteria bacterium RBG_16_38_10 TaxID=1817879 RepID=A0A1F7RX78_9BACT|nr:MAG: hypothetical protein A2W05_06165 [Candidatus Schekmanbacteria bacterium RBG_16_38_10]